MYQEFDSDNIDSAILRGKPELVTLLPDTSYILQTVKRRPKVLFCSHRNPADKWENYHSLSRKNTAFCSLGSQRNKRLPNNAMQNQA